MLPSFGPDLVLFRARQVRRTCGWKLAMSGYSLGRYRTGVLFHKRLKHILEVLRLYLITV